MFSWFGCAAVPTTKITSDFPARLQYWDGALNLCNQLSQHAEKPWVALSSSHVVPSPHDCQRCEIVTTFGDYHIVFFALMLPYYVVVKYLSFVYCAYFPMKHLDTITVFA